jgi:hypothetical protein
VASVRSRFEDELSKADQIILAEIFERVGNGSRDEIKYELETKKIPTTLSGGDF